MVQEEINLSNEIVRADSLVPCAFVIPLMEVKEFVAKIKDKIVSNDIYTADEIFRIINERAGDKLF